MKPTMIKDWELYFYLTDGYENRLKVVRAFANFWKDRKADMVAIPGRCMFGGKIYDYRGIDDGEEVFISRILTVERTEHNEYHGMPHDLMRATTELGGEFYLNSDEYSAYMFLMMEDLLNKGKLCALRYYYLPSEYRGSQLI